MVYPAVCLTSLDVHITNCCKQSDRQLSNRCVGDPLQCICGGSVCPTRKCPEIPKVLLHPAAWLKTTVAKHNGGGGLGERTLSRTKKLATWYFGHKRPLVCVLSRASDTLARITTPALRLNVQMLYITFIYNSRVSGGVCKKFYHFPFSWLKRRSAFHDITQCALFLNYCGCGGGFLSFSFFVGGILYSPLRGSDSSRL